MPSGHLWQILFGISLVINLALLYVSMMRLLRKEEQVSEDGILAMVEEGEESGTIESSEKELIENIFEFNNTTAEDVMTHRTDMVMICMQDSHEEIVETIRSPDCHAFPSAGRRWTMW